VNVSGSISLPVVLTGTGLGEGLGAGEGDGLAGVTWWACTDSLGCCGTTGTEADCGFGVADIAVGILFSKICTSDKASGPNASASIVTKHTRISML